LGGQVVGLFPWVWDTSGEAGQHQVTVALDPANTILTGDENPDNNQITVTVTVQPVAALPPSEVGATWLVETTWCCRVHVVSQTAAARDLPELLPLIDDAFRQASQRLGEEPRDRFDVYLIDRVIGQGGYAGGSMVVSYLDRNYAGGGLREVFVHEAVHLLDRQFAPDRVTLFAEGVAVWASGGHYKQEDLDQRAAALVHTGLYTPLATLADNFYPAQHEVGYLESAGFINYLVTQYGWERFRAFYADTSADDGPTIAAAVDANLMRHYGLSLEQVEAEWLAWLAGLRLDQTQVSELLTTLRYYDLMRRYQELYDPTAHFLTAWLPAPQEMEKRGLTADLARHPESDVHIALEVILTAANEALYSGDLSRANVLLNSVGRVLDNQGSFLDPLARHYLDIVQAASASGFEVQSVSLAGDQAEVVATSRIQAAPRLHLLHLVLSEQSWMVVR
jgi:hypothetical protein